MMRFVWWAVLVITLASGCGAPTAQTPPSKTLIYARGGESDRLDPIHTDIGESVKVMVNLFDTLITYDEETTDLVPGLATEWTASDDGLRWTFHLREGVRFHDNTPFDAEAVVYSFERLIRDDHPDLHSTMIPYRPDYQNIVAVRTLDPLTVEFELAEPSAVFEANLAMFPASIVSPSAVRRLGRLFATQPVGTGPFRFERWSRDQEIVLVANPDYWDGPPGVERLIFVPINENAVVVRQLLHGGVHLADSLPPAELDALIGQPGIEVQSQVGMNVCYLTMQNDKPPLDQPKVREAIWHAIDKQRLIDVAYAGRAEPAVNILPPTMWGAHDGLTDRAFDLERAKSLLAEAQSEAGFSLPLTLDLFVMGAPRPYVPQPLEAAMFIKEQLKPLGIDVRIVVNEISQHFQRLSRGEHQLALAGWSSDNADPDNFLYSLLDLDNINELGGNNVSRYRNPRVHELLLAGKRELDRERREAIYREAQEQIYADAPLVPLAHTEVRAAQSDQLRGYRLHPTGLVRLRRAQFEDAAR